MRGYLVATLALVLVVSFAGAAEAQVPASASLVPVSTHFTDPSPTPGLPSCSPDAGCGIPASGVSYYDSGSWSGKATYSALATPDVGTPGVVDISGIQTVTAKVAGCGTGTFQYTFTGTDDWRSATLGAPKQPGAPESYAWRIVAGSGTGGLKGLKDGAGTDSGTRYADASGEGLMSGWLRCVG